MSWRSWTLFAVTGFCLVVPIETWAQNYTFRKVVELSDGYDDIASKPAINNNGTVVFGARALDQQGIFVIPSGGDVKSIALIGVPFAAFSKIGGIDVGEPDINDAGRVAFYATSGCDSGIYVSDGMGPVTTIVNTGWLGIGTAHLDTRLSINNQGWVAFSIGGVPALTGVHVGNGLPIPHATSSTTKMMTLPIDPQGIHPSINNQNPPVVAYAMRSSDPILTPGRLLTKTVPITPSTPVVTMKIAPVNHNETEFWNTFPSINDSGAVAFQSRDISTNQLGIFVGSGVPVNSRFIPALLLVANNRQYPEAGQHGKLAINNSGTVAFWANYPIGGGGGVFVASTLSEEITQVIADGDTVLVNANGSPSFEITVQLVEFSPHGLNDLGQVVFFAQYIKTVKGNPVRGRGIFIATPNGELPPG